jgi:hypothetical protein
MLNLMALISINTPFNPAADKILYRHEALLKLLLSNEQRLTKEHISELCLLIRARRRRFIALFCLLRAGNC